MREGRPESPLSQCRLSHDFPWHQLRRSFPGGFYLASIGGPAAVLAEYSIKKVVVDYEDLGMEAIWKIQVEDFPAFVIINHEGRDFYTELPGDKSGGVIPLKL